MKHPLHNLAGTAALLGICHSPWILAQAANNSEAGQAGTGSRGLSEVIVTARRVEENIQSVPLAVKALSAEELSRRNVSNVNDL